ncbi:tetratricopeptide repeat protein [Pseudonocardia humida]|uniref:Tetratricopeptide repeat protein n=1 Tax=Pseudonocardia humida TaxID=2800819 RepID=A0ABT0ZVJ8_9PSEU|nr:tetratricopeptide repeat protein [Pseudonocardia humida]MCO1654746.1 tetratricopeptide repeat protein [Pseudonocardia humida]
MTTPVPTPGPEHAEPAPAAPVSVAEAPAVPVAEVDDPITEPSPLPLSEPLSAEGAALIDTGRAVDAVEVLRQAVATGEPSATDLLVRAYLDSGAWQPLVDWLVPMVEQGELRFAGRLGVALAAIGDHERAEAAFRMAVSDGQVSASNDLAILLRDQNRMGEVVQVLTWAAQQGDSQAGANLVQLYLESGDTLAAIEAAEAYADETRPDTIVSLADVRAVQGRHDEAEAYYRRACELGGLRAHTAYGQFLLSARGDAVGAEAEFREAQRHSEPNWASTLGHFLVEAGRREEARWYLQHAADSGDADAMGTLIELDGGDPTDD